MGEDIQNMCGSGAQERPSRGSLTGNAMPSKPGYGDPCNGCGLCCTAIPCTLATAFVSGEPDIGPCPALEWEDGRSWCGLIRNPSKHLAPRWKLALGGKLKRFQESVFQDLIRRGCDSGAEGGIGEDEFLGWTAAQYSAHSAESGLYWVPEDGSQSPVTSDGEVSKAAQPLQTTEPESDHCQTSGGEA